MYSCRFAVYSLNKLVIRTPLRHSFLSKYSIAMLNYKNSSNMHNSTTLQIPIYSDTYVVISKNIPSKRTKGWEVEKRTSLAKDAVSIN